jgi:hypothetical protein
MARSFPSESLPTVRAWSLAFLGALGRAAAFVSLDRAQACDGFGCVGDTLGQGVHDTGVAVERGARFTGQVVERGAYGVGTAVRGGVRATGHAVGTVTHDTGKVVTGQP